jgi:outer membrane protein
MLTQHPVTGVGALPESGELDLETLTEEALRTRPDLEALRLDVDKRQEEVTLSKSGYYPTVSLYAQAAYQGDGPELNGDGYTNKDQSAAGFRLIYNLFSGFKTQSRTEAAREAALAAKSALQAYTDRVKTELQQSFLAWQSLRQLREAAAAQVKAQQKYEAYVKGQFDNQLADADALSRAIAASALARARLIDVQARLFLAYSRTLLHVNNDRLFQALHLTPKD